ncbi:hypothetical protein NUM3379_20210 [Kineococcus sp. NUM-3379]
MAFAVAHYRVAVLQPWETHVLHRLKDARPDMTVLAYKCLSSTRDYEPGPVFTSGVSHAEAEEAGGGWFARRRDGSRVQWRSYPGHWQMAVWDAAYRERWCRNVVAEVAGSRWDGVLADNDVFDDYYGIDPPLAGGYTMADVRAGLEELVARAGAALNAVGSLLVPNIAESRREPGRWQRHAAFGGGLEEVWLAWGPREFLDPPTALAQAPQVPGPGLTLFRTATDGSDTHPNFRYGLAAFWVFGGGAGGAMTATGRDEHSGTPWVPELGWDLGAPREAPRREGPCWVRAFSGGWAAVHLGDGGAAAACPVPPGLLDAGDRPAPQRVWLAPHEGVLLRSAGR